MLRLCPGSGSGMAKTSLKELRGVEEYECEQLSSERSLSNSSSGNGVDTCVRWTLFCWLMALPWVRSSFSWPFPSRISSSTQSTESQGMNEGSMSSQSSQGDRKLSMVTDLVWGCVRVQSCEGSEDNLVRIALITLKGCVGDLEMVEFLTL